ncbi:PDZ domain-containing protein [Actinomyces procaprae]|uniref:YlbL family protein n=1 Tax=Actinomyces procaprae TaxID=2560010 RepID=UPI001EFF9EAA|nr:S16 family serine protease [Actinomyces procaprae]
MTLRPSNAPGADSHVATPRGTDPADTSTSPNADAPAPAAQTAGDLAPGPRRRLFRGRRRAGLMIGLALVVALVIAGATVPINKVIQAPGPTWNVLADASDGADEDLLTVTGTETFETSGALRMTTVSVSGCPGYPVTFFMLVDAWLSSDKTILERDQVCPESLTAEQVEEVNQAQMTSSQDAAVVAALMETGAATRMTLTVEGTVDEQAGSGLEVGDVLESITTADGATTTITSYPQLRELMTTIAPATPLTLRVNRDGAAVDVELTTIAPQDADGDGEPDSEGSLLGLSLSARADSDVDATFSLSDVGGPSAGTIFALGIIDEITPGDLTGGKDIAGTGTISIDGTVGAIGGIKQKMAGAHKDGSDYFLAPAANCNEVVGSVPDGLEVYAVETLHEAVEAVEAIAAEDTSELMTCEAVLGAG